MKKGFYNKLNEKEKEEIREDVKEFLERITEATKGETGEKQYAKCLLIDMEKREQFYEMLKYLREEENLNYKKINTKEAEIVWGMKTPKI